MHYKKDVVGFGIDLPDPLHQAKLFISKAIKIRLAFVKQNDIKQERFPNRISKEEGSDPKVYLAHFLFMQDIQGIRKDHAVLKINQLKINFGQTKDILKGKILV